MYNPDKPIDYYVPPNIMELIDPATDFSPKYLGHNHKVTIELLQMSDEYKRVPIDHIFLIRAKERSTMMYDDDVFGKDFSQKYKDGRWYLPLANASFGIASDMVGERVRIADIIRTFPIAIIDMDELHEQHPEIVEKYKGMRITESYTVTAPPDPYDPFNYLGDAGLPIYDPVLPERAGLSE